MKKIHIGQIQVPYEISWSHKRSSVGLAIDQSMKLDVKAPISSTLEEIEEVLEQKKSWLLDKIHDFKGQKEAPRDKDFLSGEKLLYNGRRYRLKVKKDDSKNEPTVSFGQNRFNLLIPDYEDEKLQREKSRKAVINWYKNKSQDKLINRAEKYSKEIGVEPKKIKVKSLNKKWGRHKQKTLEFHWRLILAPTNIQDYVIVHELAHIQEHNHGKRFWSIVGSVLPDYEDRIEWLRVNGRELVI